MADDSESWLKVGARVLVKDKNWLGVVRFFGRTDFAPGKWVGVELDEGLGKNNGVVKGKSYFTCKDQHGLMVRPTQLEPSSSSSAGTSIPLPRSHKKPAGASPGLSRRSQLPKPNVGTPTSGTRPSPKGSPNLSVPEEHRPPAQPITVSPGSAPVQQALGPVLAPASPVISRSNIGGGGGEASQEVIDLQQKLAILQSKRQDDKARIKDLEKYRMQFQQMVDYKAKWTESQAELVQQLKQAKKDAREAMLLKEQAEEEMRELADTVEIATLDKEMAEEKCENLQAEIELLKEEKKEIMIDLDIIRDEIKESGYEGAAASAELKQLEQQNARLKEALVRLRDLSTHEKQEHQRLVKDLEKQTTTLVTLRDQKERLEAELKEADCLIDELKEQVDVALGAEEMVEKLTEKNLELEEQIQELQEKANDLEELRELSEQQEELIMETEHELREEVDMSQNQIRQLERRLEASQDTIIDQQQTIEKFREVVRHLQSDINELRQQSKEGREDATTSAAANVFTSPDTMLSQFKTTAIKTYSRTIDYELRKLEAQQSAEMINILKSFMPNTFLVSGGDYDALNVFMLLPRMIFKSELIMEQLRQQTSLEETLGTGTVLKPGPKTDLLAYTAFLIFKLSTLQLLVNKAIRALSECDVQLYRQMGCLRDDLALHERALDILIELLKKEQLDESVPLNGVEKAINHFENLLQTRLTHIPQRGQTDQLLDQMKVMMAGCNFSSVELMRIRSHAQETSSFVSQLKELDTLFGDVHLSCRKIRRRVPPLESGKMVVCPPELMTALIQKQLMLVTNLRALYVRVNQKAQALSEGESLTSGELETFLQDITKMVLQEMLVTEETTPEELMHVILLKVTKTLEKFLSELQEGVFDQESPKTKEVLPVVTRAQVVKGELSDTEGLKYKVEEKNKEILELKKAVKLKVQEIGEVNIKVGLLEKKLETADSECARKVEEEQQETERIRNIMESQERKFNKAIEVLQGDIEALENEKDSLKKQLDKQVRVPTGPEVSIARRSHTVIGRPTISALLRSPGMVRKNVSVDQAPAAGGGEATEAEPPPNSPLLLARIDSLRKALSLTQEENSRLKGQIARAQMASLNSLHVPRRVPSCGHGSKPGGSEEEEDENKSDLEKSIRKEKSVLFKELSSFLGSPVVVDITKKPDPGVTTGKPATELTPREKLNLQISSLLQLRQKSSKLREESQRLIASSQPGGMVQSQVKGFVAPQLTKALDEASSPLMVARLRLPLTAAPSCVSTETPRKLLLSMHQFQALHSVVAN